MAIKNVVNHNASNAMGKNNARHVMKIQITLEKMNPNYPVHANKTLSLKLEGIMSQIIQYVRNVVIFGKNIKSYKNIFKYKVK